jgi:hypothetical protein
LKVPDLRVCRIVAGPDYHSACLLIRRSQVRALVGAQVKEFS